MAKLYSDRYFEVYQEGNFYQLRFNRTTFYIPIETFKKKIEPACRDASYDLFKRTIGDFNSKILDALQSRQISPSSLREAFLNARKKELERIAQGGK